jgi:hypothetical protein
MEPLHRLTRERHRIDALHDAIAIMIAEIGLRDLALRDSIVRRLRDEEKKLAAEHPPDERGMGPPLPVELASLCDSIQLFGRSPPPAYPGHS